MSRGGRLRRGSEPTRTTNLDGIFTLNECADYIAEDKWPTIPDAVSDLAVTGGDGTLVLSWSAPSSNGLPFSLYIIEYTPSGGSATTVTTSNTSYQITGLTNDLEYSVRVGVKVGNRINYSTAVTGTPSAGGPPGQVATLSTSSDESSIFLSWSAPTDLGGGAITGYRIYFTGSNTGCNNSGTSYTVSGAATSWSYPGSINVSWPCSYTATVYAINEFGEGVGRSVSGNKGYEN